MRWSCEVILQPAPGAIGGGHGVWGALDGHVFLEKGTTQEASPLRGSASFNRSLVAR